MLESKCSKHNACPQHRKISQVLEELVWCLMQLNRNVVVTAKDVELDSKERLEEIYNLDQRHHSRMSRSIMVRRIRSQTVPVHMRIDVRTEPMWRRALGKVQ